ncbi:unnamed protein product, partial [Brassica oleracea]
MAGASSLQQAADPPDPRAGTFGSGFPLHPSQCPPLPHSPETASKLQISPPTFPSSSWGSGKSVVPGLSPDNRATTMVNLESSSTTMDISLTKLSNQISGKRLDKPQILFSEKIKEIDFISAQYTTLSASEGKRGSVENPKNDITAPPVVTSESSKALPQASGPEILSNPFSKPSKISPSVPVTVSLPVDYAIPHVPAGSGQEDPSVDASSQNPPNIDSQTSGNSSKPPPSDMTYAGKAKMGTDRS